MWIQTGVTVRKRLIWVLTSVTLTFDLWPWPFAWTSLLSLVITPENFILIRWWEHGEKGVTDGRTDRQTDRWTDGLNQSDSCLVAAKRSQRWYLNGAKFIETSMCMVFSIVVHQININMSKNKPNRVHILSITEDVTYVTVWFRPCSAAVKTGPDDIHVDTNILAHYKYVVLWFVQSWCHCLQDESPLLLIQNKYWRLIPKSDETNSRYGISWLVMTCWHKLSKHQ